MFIMLSSRFVKLSGMFIKLSGMFVQEVKPNMVEPITQVNQPVERVLEELMDGDIIVFQCDYPDQENQDLPNIKEYFR